MEKSDIRYQAYVSILEEELKPAMGCTEPIAIAYCAAVAREVLGGLHIGYSQEFREKAEKAAYERLAKDPQHAGKPEDELKKLARYAVNDKTRIGTMTALEPKQPQAFTGQATAVGTTDWVPPTVDENGNVMPGDDLPF